MNIDTEADIDIDMYADQYGDIEMGLDRDMNN